MAELNSRGRQVNYTQSSITDKILAGIKYEIIQEKRPELVQSLNPDRHIDYLRSKCLLSEEDVEEIRFEKTRKKRASLFLDFILKNGPKAYDKLCESLLAERTQIFLLEMLNIEYERRKNAYLAMAVVRPQNPVMAPQNFNMNPVSLPKPSQFRNREPQPQDNSNVEADRHGLESPC